MNQCWVTFHGPFSGNRDIFFSILTIVQFCRAIGIHCTLKVVHIFCNVVCTTCFTLCRWLLFCILPLWTVWHTVLVSVFPSPSPLPPPPPPFGFFSFQIWILCQNSLTRELKIRVEGFALKKLVTHFEMLIVLHALHCVNGHYFVFYLFWQSVILFWSQC